MTQQSLTSNISSSERWFIIITVMLVAVLEVLDSTIVNVALPSMMSSLGATQDQITWVLTSYVVASAIMIPLTGFISKSIGEKSLLIIDISGFMLFSFLCGAAQTLDMMVTTRILQGAFGASLIPLSQSIMRQSFTKSQQGKAMAIWGIGLMVAPVLGPTLGGVIVEHASWRWVFYINAPVCLTALIMAITFIPKIKGSRQSIDTWGIITMFIGIGSLQIFLDQGNTKDWFNSNSIIVLLTCAVIGFMFFIHHSLTTTKPAVALRLFGNRNFMSSTIIFATYCGCVFGVLTLEPMMLETLFGYTALNAGLTLAPMGLFSAVSMITVSMLIGKIRVQYLLLTGLLFLALGCYQLSSITLEASNEQFYHANLLMGIGLGTIMVPLSTFALITLKKEQITEASGLYNYGRMLGTSVGISLLSTLVSRSTQRHWHALSGAINTFNPNLKYWLMQQGGSLQDPQTLAILNQTLSAQAGLQGFISAFQIASFALLCIIPLTFLIKNVKLTDDTPTISH